MPNVYDKVVWGLLTSVSLMGASESNAEDAFVTDSHLNVLARNFYLDTDYKKDTPGAKDRNEWAQGFIANFTSGFTEGLIGVGVDAHGFLGLKLDSGRGRSGTGLLPVDSKGEAPDEYSDAGGVVKFRVSKTVLRVGEMTVAAPVFDTADLRLQPEYASGVLLTSSEIKDLVLTAGHFTGFKNQNSTDSRGEFKGYGASTAGGGIDFVGGDYTYSDQTGGSLYMSNLTDTWYQYYTNLHHTIELTPAQNLKFDFNLYHTDDQGKALAGPINNTIYSLAATYRFYQHGITLAYQKVEGDTPFDYIGGDSEWIANSAKIAKFNGAGEKSWQLKYDLDMAGYGVPGLKFFARYVTGSGINGTHAPVGNVYYPFNPATNTYMPIQGRDGKQWERDIDVKYTVQTGPAKDLSMHMTHVTSRANAAQGSGDFDRLYLVVEYPINVF